MKKIPVAQLRVGMYVERLCGAWLASPFWTRSLLVDSAAKVQKIHASGIAEVVIDLRKGCDVADPSGQNDAGGADADAVDDPSSASAHAPGDASAAPQAPARAHAAGARPAPPLFDHSYRFPATQPTSMAQELRGAGALLANSRDAVASMFAEARMGRAIDAAQMQPLVDEIALSVIRNPDALIGLVRLKDAHDYTYMHSVAVCALMIALARQLSLPDGQVRELGLAGLLHDVGKMKVPAALLDKPDKLTDDEFNVIKHHPTAGYRLLFDGAGVPAAVLDVCLHHHEKMDGSGYPEGLSGDQISLAARMGAICDVYDAITSNRPYKPGWCPAASLRKMTAWCHGHFDPAVFAAFVKCMGIYPVGTLVRLQSGLLAVVVDQQHAKTLLRPVVRTLFCTRTQQPVTPRLLNLDDPAASERIAGHEDPAHWPLAGFDHAWHAGVAA